MSKSCDLAMIVNGRVTYASENPGVFTNAICYLDWIANQYGLRMPDDFKKPSSCSESKGNIHDLQKKSCRASGDFIKTSLDISNEYPFLQNSSRFTYCDFTQKNWEQCELFAQEGYAYNLYQCKDKSNQTVICANNCKGVDPNAVVVGGTALAAAATISGLTLLQGALPVGLGLAVIGGVTVAEGQCPPLSCRVSKK